MMELSQLSLKPFFSIERPLDLMPNGRQMRIANLGAFPRLAKAFGVDHRRLLERHAIDPQEIQSPDQLIDCKDFIELLEECSSSVNEPLFGLRLAQLHEPDVYGCVIALCRAAATFRQSLESFVKYLRVTHSSASVQELVEGKQTSEYRWYVRTELGCNQQANYHATLLIIKLLRQIGGPNFRPSYINLTVDARSKDIAKLEQLFGCRFHCNVSNNSIGFPTEFLDRRIPSSSRVLYTLLSGYLDKLASASEISVTSKVENYIRSSLTTEPCTIENCAQQLGMAVRTLQTKLSENGDEFSTILEQQRTLLAKSYLKKQLSLDDVAANLGYAESSSFGRAFKRWTGLTPKQYRQATL